MLNPFHILSLSHYILILKMRNPRLTEAKKTCWRSQSKEMANQDSNIDQTIENSIFFPVNQRGGKQKRQKSEEKKDSSPATKKTGTQWRPSLHTDNCLSLNIASFRVKQSLACMKGMSHSAPQPIASQEKTILQSNLTTLFSGSFSCNTKLSYRSQPKHALSNLILLLVTSGDSKDF